MRRSLAAALVCLVPALTHAQTKRPASPPAGRPAAKATAPPASRPGASPKPAAGSGSDTTVAPAPAATAASGGSFSIEEPSEWNATTRGLQLQSRRSTRVAGLATHPDGVVRVELNGSRMAVQPSANGSVRFSGYLAYDANATTAELTATTTNGQRFTQKYKVNPTIVKDSATVAANAPAPPPQVAFEQQTAGFKGKRWAVIVGVSKYKDPRITGLQYADADAKALYNFLRSERSGMGGFAPENIKLLLNEGATFRQIRIALYDFLKGATEDDVVYIYFAGHGSPDPDRPENLYLIPYDADADNLSGTGLPMEDISTAVKRLYARQKVVITDACHSAGVGGGVGQRALAMNQINRVFIDQMEASNGGLAVFTASEASQYSQEGPQWGGGHGVFTHYLIEALKGAADEDQDQLVSLGEMMEWVRTRVRRETRNAQIPTISQTSFDRNWPMAVVLPGSEVPVISDEEIEASQKLSTVMSSAYDSPWLAPDSLVAVVGMSDSLRVRLANESKDVLPGHLLTWTSSNPEVARVDGAGVVHAQTPGAVQITASGFNRRVSVPVHVYGRPTEIVFTPTDTVLTVVQGENLDFRVDLVVGPGTRLRGLVPFIAAPDTFLLGREAPGRFLALRAGETTLRGVIAGYTRNWRVRIVPPRVKLPPTRGALLLGDSMRVGALRVRPDGTVLGEAASVVWQSSRPDIAVVQNGVVSARSIGQTTLTASLGMSQDSMVISVVGDLLLSTTGRGGRTIQTVSLASGKAFALSDSLKEAWSAALSPDGRQIAYISSKGGPARLWVANVNGTGARRVLQEQKGALGFRMSGYEEHTPSWTHDGSRIVFVSNSPGNYEIFSVAPDGSDLQRLTEGPAVDWRVSTAPDIPRIAFERTVAAGDADLVVALPDGNEPHVLSFAGTFRVREAKPKLLAGGRQLVYARGGMNLDERAGETLSVMEISTGNTVRDVVHPIKDHELVFTVSPDGTRIAYHQHGRWKCSNNSVVVIDITGTVLKTINLGANTDIREIGWGATPIRTTPENP